MKELTKLSERFTDALKAAAEDVICDHLYDLENTEEICGLIAETNATDWEVSEHEVDDAGIDDEGNVVVTMSFIMKGANDQDRPFSGDTIKGTCTISIDNEEQITFTSVQAEHEDVRDPDDK